LVKSECQQKSLPLDNEKVYHQGVKKGANFSPNTTTSINKMGDTRNIGTTI